MSTNIKTMMEELAQEELERDGAACREVMQSRKGAGAHGKMRLIDADALIEAMKKADKADPELSTYWSRGSISRIIKQLPTVDAVEVEKYNDLREAFVDFVCSGVHNPAPYCKNACDECVDERGWCTYRRCNGFNPDGERRSGDAHSIK